MVLRKGIPHPNDRSFTYISMVNPMLLHRYLKLPGIYANSFSNVLVTRNMKKLEMDMLMYVKADGKTLFEDMLINIEQQSSDVGDEKIKTIVDYRDYSKSTYGLPVLSVVLMTCNPKNSIKEYAVTDSDIIRPVYIWFSWDEIQKRLNNLTIKIGNNEELTEEEALDIAFLPMFSPKDKAKYVTRKVCKLFKQEKSVNPELKANVSVILETMVLKYFSDVDEIEELLDMTIDELRSNIIRQMIEDEMPTVEDKVSYLKEEISLVNKENVYLKEEVSEVNNEIASLKEEVSEVNNELNSLKEGINQSVIRMKEMGISDDAINVVNQLILLK